MLEAFRIRGGEGRHALLAHGFTGSPYEMLPLGKAIGAAGWDVLGLRLPGHGAAAGGEANDVAAWRQATEAGLSELTADGGHVAVVGLSMGALLALDLAAREPERVGAVVALSPALSLPFRLRAILRVAGRLAPASVRGRKLPKGESDIRDALARAAHPRSPPVPVASLLSFNDLRLAVRKRVRDVRQPILVVHSRLDRTCPVAGARWLARHVGSRQVELHLLERSGHVIPVDLEQETAARLVIDFLDRTIPPSPLATRHGR